MAGNDDYAAMEEVLTRRLTAYLASRNDPPPLPGRRPPKFAYPPQLLLVDGGKGQLAVAEKVVDRLGLRDEIPVAGLAKRFEQVYVPGQADPVDVPRGSEALFMLQRIRDEAHRFANTFHGERRSKRMTRGSLEGIAGLGEVRQKRLVKEMGGVNVVKQASLADLQALAWLPDAVAAAIHERFHPTANAIWHRRSRIGRCVTDGHRDGGDQMATYRRVTVTQSELWEANAGWWIDGFTDGADPEYAEQILPLAAAELAGSRRVLDVGCGDGQVTRLALALDGVELAVGVDPTWNQISVAAERGGTSGVARALADALPFADGVVRRRGGVPGVRAHRRGRRGASPRSPGCSRPAAASASSSTTRCCRRPTAAGSTTRCSSHPSSTGASGPTSSRPRRSRRWRRTSTSASSTARCRRYVNTLAEHGLLIERMLEPSPPEGFLALTPEYAAAATVPRLLYLRLRKLSVLLA